MLCLVQHDEYKMKHAESEAAGFVPSGSCGLSSAGLMLMARAPLLCTVQYRTVLVLVLVRPYRSTYRPTVVRVRHGRMVGRWLQHPCKDGDEPPWRNLCESLGLAYCSDSRDVKAFEASYILSYNVVQAGPGS